MDRSGAETLGLGGWVDDDGFMALMDGRDPGTGERVKRVGGRSKGGGVRPDVLRAQVGQRAVRHRRAEAGRALVEAHDSAVDAAVDYVEREACRVRRGRRRCGVR